MRLDEKARENLEAAGRLLPDDASEREPLNNASASRAYYAAYLAIAHEAQARDLAFTGRRAYYRHDRFPEDARGAGIVDDATAEDLRWLYTLRIKADYYADQVNLEEASEAFGVAEAIVERVLPRGSAS